MENVLLKTFGIKHENIQSFPNEINFIEVKIKNYSIKINGITIRIRDEGSSTELHLKLRLEDIELFGDFDLSHPGYSSA
jgi:hypothetical protein